MPKDITKIILHNQIVLVGHAPVFPASPVEPEFSFIPESANKTFGPKRVRGANMKDKHSSLNSYENPDPQEKRVSEDDITPTKEHILPDRLPNQPKPACKRVPH